VIPRQVLARLIEPVDGVWEAHPVRRDRPLGWFSTFVCEELGVRNEMIRTGRLEPGDLFATVEAFMADLPDGLFRELAEPARTADRRIALLDLLWASRSLDIAYGGIAKYRDRRRGSALFGRSAALARVERRHPVLSWSEIAIYHPVGDPRSFLPPGSDRDQEVLMYRVQAAIERTFKAILDYDPAAVDTSTLVEMNADLDCVVKAMVHLNRSRTLGQFYKLDPFLGPNEEYRGHGTGAFSVWSYVLGLFLSGNPTMRSRLLDEANQLAFDRDADPLVDQVRRGEFATLDRVVADAGLGRSDETDHLCAQARTKFALFLHSHRGAIKRHARDSFGATAPSCPTMTNEESIKASLAGTQSTRPRSRR
jgi:hypothetical protein